MKSGFWMVAATFLTAMAFSTVPTPLWPLYQQADGFPTSMVTVAFSAYAVGVLISLFLAGHVSDWVGRRRVLLPGVLLEILAAALFLANHELPVLIIARVICGLGTGLITATATAHLGDLAARAGIRYSGHVATAANLGGLGLGPLVSGFLAQYVDGPLTTVYIVFLVLLAVCAIGVTLVPETVTATPRRYRPQRVSVPSAARREYFVTAAGAFTAFALFGLFTSLTPKLLAASVGTSSALLSGAVSCAVFLFGVLAQLSSGRLGLDRQLTIGVGALVGGVAVLLAGGVAGSLTLFVLAGALAGAGAGLLFKGAMASAARLADPAAKGEAAAGVFLAGYLGLTVPIMGLGAAARYVSLTTGLIAFCLVILVLLAGVGLQLRTLRA
ncbi:MFS transporter [Actinophytocola sp.]|uniref:MFS transporter n=1 Tax=Actinophytocola sp. TaxID=1872138 RepID=UPI002ED04848